MEDIQRRRLPAPRDQEGYVGVQDGGRIAAYIGAR